MIQLSAPVVSCEEVLPQTFLLWLKAPQITSECKPGQFVTLRCSEGFSPLLRRPLSIHRVQDDNLALLFDVIGNGTKWLSRKTEGQFIDITGPLGNGFSIGTETKKLLLVAGGIGTAPMVYVAEQALLKNIEVKLLAGAISESRLYKPELRNAEIICCTDDGSAGQKGVTTDLLPALSSWADEILACGPIAMYRTINQMKCELHQKPVKIMMEQVMACGVGACRGCAVSTSTGLKMACTDGPVFDLSEILWD